jgi:diguanylate cyclase (GGDEF)-like protein
MFAEGKIARPITTAVDRSIDRLSNGPARVHDVLPGELITFRAVGVLGYGLGGIGGVALWLTRADTIHCVTVAGITTTACFVMSAVMAATPWNRVRSGWLLVLPLVALVVTTVGIANQTGGREVYEGFYLYIALAVSYFLSPFQVRVTLGGIAVASAVPLLSDRSPESIVRWIYVAAGTTTVAMVLQLARRRVRQYAAEVRTLALHDQLTGALNRRGFEERARQEISRAQRQEQYLTLLYLDLDGFKQVNDNLGHAAGDFVLRSAGCAMAGVLRDEEVLARVGGDEFVVLLFTDSDEIADRVAARLVAAIEGAVAHQVGADHVSATVARAVLYRDGDTLDALLEAADTRMLDLKRARRGSVGER